LTELAIFEAVLRQDNRPADYDHYEEAIAEGKRNKGYNSC